MTNADNLSRCDFIGSADAYGLGIRIGAYTQWFASVLAYALPPVETEALRSVNTCFQMAMLVSLSYWTVEGPKTLHAAEAFIMLLLCFGGVSACQQWSKRPLQQIRGSDAFSLSGLGNFARTLVALGACCYGLWLTIRGDQHLASEADCKTRVFFFAPVDLFGWYRYVMIVAFALGALSGTVMIVVVVFGAYQQFDAWMKDWRDHEPSAEEDGEYRPSIIVLAAACVGLAIFGLAIELTIMWNGITGVQSCNSVGQLFPLIVGVAGLARIIWSFAAGFVLGEISFRREIV